MIWFLAQFDAQSSAGGQLRNFIEGLGTAEGITAIALFLLLLVVAALVRDVKWFVLGLMLWGVTLTFTTSDYFKPQLMFPLAQLSLQGRGFTIALLLILMVPTLRADRGWRNQLAVGALWTFFIYEVVFSLRLGMAGLSERALFGIIIFSLTLIVMVGGLGRWLQDVPDANKLLRGIVFCGILFTLGTLLQMLKDRTQIIHNGRLFGTTGNPQHFGAASAMLIPAACYVLVQRAQPIYWRVLAGGVVGFLLIFLGWTQSRTGAVMFIVHMVLLFRFRIARILVLALFGGGTLFVAFNWIGRDIDLTHLISSENTRAGVWSALISQFLSSPIVGRVGSDVEAGESSYLSTLARFGLMGGIPLITTVGLSGVAVFRLHKVKRFLGDQKLLADYATSGLAAIAIGAAFEAFLLGTLAFAVFMAYILLVLITFLIDLGNFRKTQAEYDLANADMFNAYEAQPSY